MILHYLWKKKKNTLDFILITFLRLVCYLKWRQRFDCNSTFSSFSVVPNRMDKQPRSCSCKGGFVIGTVSSQSGDNWKGKPLILWLNLFVVTGFGHRLHNANLKVCFSRVEVTVTNHALSDVTAFFKAAASSILRSLVCGVFMLSFVRRFWFSLNCLWFFIIPRKSGVFRQFRFR